MTHPKNPEEKISKIPTTPIPRELSEKIADEELERWKDTLEWLEKYDESFDEDSYPTEEALKNLHCFKGSIDQQLKYVEHLWNTDYGRINYNFISAGSGPTYYVTKRITLVTGGWSGNEDIITALEGTLFWRLGWQSSHRGGLHIFEFKQLHADYTDTNDR